MTDNAATYAEYRTNLSGMVGTYGTPLHGVSDASVIFDGPIPVSAILARFETERVESYESGYLIPNDGSKTGADAWITDTTRRANVRLRDGKVHGLFGADVPRNQYSFLVDVLTGVTGTGRGDLKFVAGGTTRNGGRAYVQVALGDVQSVHGMEWYSHLTVGMSHDGSLSVSSVLGTTALICGNMVDSIFGATRTGLVARSKQSKLATPGGIITKHNAVLGINAADAAFAEGITKLGDTAFTDSDWSEFVQACFPIAETAGKATVTRAENNRESMTALYKGDTRVTPWHGTALGALQAANVWDLWERNTRGEGNHAATRMWDEHLSGTLSKTEASRADTLARVLVHA